MMNRNSKSTTYQNSYKTFRNIQWRYLYCRMVLFHWWQPSTTSLMIVPILIVLISTLEIALANILRDVLVLMSTLEIALANIFRDVLVLLEVADVHQCSKVDFPYLLFYVPSLCCRFCIWNQHCLGWKIFFHTSRFPEACVSERRISRIFWTFVTLDSWSSLTKTTFGAHTSFFPGSHLRVSRTPPDFEVYLKNFVSQTRCAARRDNVCLLSPSKRMKWRASLRSFHRNEFLRKVVIEYRIPSFPCNINTIEIVFASDMFGFSPILSPHRIFLLGRVSFNDVNLVKEKWLFSRHVSWTSRFNMMTINEILSELLRDPKNPYWFLRHLLFLQVETLPYRHEILRWDSLVAFHRIRPPLIIRSTLQ